MLIKHYQVLDESTMATRPIKGGSLYICSESRHIYFDTVTTPNERILLDTNIIVATEEDRANIESPLEGVLYFVTSSKIFYIYSNGEWHTTTDNILSVEGMAADAKAVGDAISKAIISSSEYTDKKFNDFKKTVDEEFESIDNTFTGIDQRFTKVDEELNNLGSTIESAIEDNEKISDLEKNIDSNTKALEALTNDADESMNTMGLLATAIKKNSKEIEDLKNSGIISEGSTVHIGITPPESDDFDIWIDTSGEHAYLKYKNEAGVWTVISGGGGTSSGGEDYVNFKVTNTGGWLSKTLSYGAKCVINLSWYSIEDGISTGVGTVKIVDKILGQTKQVYEVQQGDIEIDVTSFLVMGNNELEITISDVYNNSRPINFNITTVSISISSYFDGTAAYTGNITYTYTPVGAIEKTVHFILDGKEIDTQTVTTSNREQSFIIPAQPHGNHTFKVYFTGKIDGIDVESNPLEYDLICYETGNRTPVISIPFYETTATQFSTIPFQYIVYTPDIITSEIELLENGNSVMPLSVGRSIQTWSYKALDHGDVTLGVKCGDIVRSKTITVTESSIDIQAETNNLELYLTSAGRSNMETNPLTWTSNGVEAQMTGFNLASDGWVLDDNNNTVLRVAGDARVYIPFNIFGGDFRTTGKTIEMEFATRDVLNYDTTIISSWNDNRGITITAQKATLRSEQKEIFTQYKEDETVRITFCIEKRAENRLLSIYINGVMSGVVQYPDDDDFSQPIPVGITIGSNDCTTDIYSIRVYNTNLTRYQILDNWIADTQNIELMIERYERNNIFDDYGNISVHKLPTYLPYMVIYSNSYEELPQFKGDKKTVSGKYVDPLHPERSFTFEGAQIDVQGTSSQFYSRKNYKLKLKNGLTINGVYAETYAMRETSMPTAEFCFKADVASSEGCNNVELVRLYDDICPVKTYPQTIDPRVRQGIEGYPMVMFYGPDDTDLHFLGKYNFNNDKGTPEVYGLGDDDESWEVKLNTTDMAVWKDDDFESTYWNEEDKEYQPTWTQTFEARHPEDSTNITNLKAFATWIKSTDTTESGITEEEKQARIEKFKNEFKIYANVELMLFNYIFTETFLMVDNRAKNAFPTRYGEDGKWLILPYDYDTAIGIDNEGGLKFGYELEDIDIIKNANVFNGQDSILYVNMRLAFFNEIREMYRTLRTETGSPFNYTEVARRFTEHQAVWGEAIFNEDGRFKYIDPLVNDNDTSYLPMAQGSKEEQRKWWLYNRFRYLDSKYNAADALDDFIMVRTYGVADIEITPYADIYATASFDGNLVQARALRGSSYILKNPLSSANHAVVAIYSAGQLNDIGDLSGLKISWANFSTGVKLSALRVGSNKEGYTNPNLTYLNIGNLTLLRLLDVRNCINLEDSIDISGCTNIEYVYFDGTKIAGIKLPDGGNIKALHIPNTITALTIMNQPNLTDFQMPSYENISTLRLEAVDQSIFDTLTIIDQIKPSSRIRIIGVEWNLPTAEDIFYVMDKLDTFRGLDENGGNLDTAIISGVINTGTITTNDLAEMYKRYPNLKINYENISAIVNFYNDDVLLYTTTIWNYADCPDPIAEGIFEIPTKETDDTAKYKFSHWSLPLTKVTEYRDIKAVYEVSMKYYVTFIDGEGNPIPVNGNDTNIYYNLDDERTITIPEVPEYVTTVDGVNYIHRFSGWLNEETGGTEILDVSGDDYSINYTAQYTVHRVWVTTFMNEDEVHSIQYKCTGESIEIPEIPTKASTVFLDFHFAGWSLDGETIIDPELIVGEEDIVYKAVYTSTDIYHTITFTNVDQIISEQSLQYGQSIAIPDDPTKESTEYLNFTFAGWSLDGETVVDVDIVGETDLCYIAIYTESTRYYTVNFYNGDKLLDTKYVTYNTDAVYEGATPETEDDQTFTGWLPVCTEIKEDTDCYAQFVYYLTHRFVRRTMIELETDVKTLAATAFYGCTQLTSINLTNATFIGQEAFLGCTNLVDIKIPMVTDISMRSFYRCKGITKLEMYSATSIGSEAFYNCSGITMVDTMELADISTNAFNGCSNLDTFIIRNYNTMCELLATSAFTNTPIASGTGYVYVPMIMYELYIENSVWKTFANQIRIIEEYPDICGEVEL